MAATPLYNFLAWGEGMIGEYSNFIQKVWSTTVRGQSRVDMAAEVALCNETG